MQVNFNDIDTEKSFMLYEKGPQRVRIKSIEDVKASTGNNQLRIKTEIIGGDYDGKQLTDHVTLVDSCEWKLGKFVAGCGLDIKSLGSMDKESGAFRAMLNKLINKTSIWIVDQQADRNGNLRNTVADYQPDPDAKEIVEDTPEFLE